MGTMGVEQKLRGGVKLFVSQTAVGVVLINFSFSGKGDPGRTN